MESLRHLSRTAALLLAALTFVVSCGKTEPEKEVKPNPDPGPGPTPEVKTPVIKAGNASFPGNGGTYELVVTVENPADGAVLSAEVIYPEDAPSGWATVGSPTATGISITLADNLSYSRETEVKLSYPKAESVTVKLEQGLFDYPEFEIAISKVGPFGATFDITRKSGYGGGYFFEVLDMPDFEKYVSGETHKVGEFAYADALYQSDVNYLKRMAEKHGHPLADLFTMLPGMYSKEPTVSIPYSGLAVETEYMFVVYGMEANNDATLKTPICFFSFKTGYSSESALTFSGSATDVTENYAELSVTPSNNAEYWYMNWASEIELASTTPAEIMQKSINNAKTLLSRYTAEQILCHGKETIQATDLVPGTDYTVFAWGMNLDMTATTEPKEVFTFRTKEYEIVDDCTFQIEVLQIQDMDVQVRVTPSKQTTRYYVAFVDVDKMEGYTDEQAAQRIINMEASRIENHYYDVENLSWANLPGLEAGTREIWGRKDEGWSFQPNHDYHIYVFGIDNFGIRSTGVARLDVRTAEPTASSNHFDVAVEKASWLGVDYTVTPEIADEYWMPFFIETAELDYFRNADGSLKEKEIMHEIEEYYEDEIIYNTYSGTRTLHAHVVPDTQYSILVFGYSGTNTTRMYEWKVYAPAPPLGKSTADYTYTFELFRGEDLADLDPRVWPHVDFDGDCVMLVRLTPTDNAVLWYFGVWPPKENFRDQGGQYYLMTLDMNPDVAGSAMQDKKVFRTRPWWYGCGNGSATNKEPWADDEGNMMSYYPWTLSGWAEDADGNYGPWHYDYLIPIPRPKEEVTGNYEVGYTEAYNFWSAPNQVSNIQVYSVSDGKNIPF